MHRNTLAIDFLDFLNFRTLYSITYTIENDICCDPAPPPRISHDTLMRYHSTNKSVIYLFQKLMGHGIYIIKDEITIKIYLFKCIYLFEINSCHSLDRWSGDGYKTLPLPYMIVHDFSLQRLPSNGNHEINGRSHILFCDKKDACSSNTTLETYLKN